MNLFVSSMKPKSIAFFKFLILLLPGFGCQFFDGTQHLSKGWTVYSPQHKVWSIHGQPKRPPEKSKRAKGFTGRLVQLPEEGPRDSFLVHFFTWTDRIDFEDLSQLEDAYKNRSQQFKREEAQAKFRLRNLKDNLNQEPTGPNIILKIKDIDARLTALQVPGPLSDPGMVFDLVGESVDLKIFELYNVDSEGTVLFDKSVGKVSISMLLEQIEERKLKSQKPIRYKFISTVKSELKKNSEEPFKQAFEEYLSNCPESSLHCHYTQLEWLDAVRRKEHLPKVIQAADEVIKVVKADPDHRELYIDALYRKGRALAYMELPDVITKHPIEDPLAHERLFQATYDELSSLVDMESKKYFLLHIRYLRRKGLYGLALEVLQKHIDAGDAPYLYYKKRRDLYGLCGWGHRWMREGERLLHLFPKVPGRLGEKMPTR